MYILKLEGARQCYIINIIIPVKCINCYTYLVIPIEMHN